MYNAMNHWWHQEHVNTPLSVKRNLSLLQGDAYASLKSTAASKLIIFGHRLSVNLLLNKHMSETNTRFSWSQKLEKYG